MWRKKVFSPPVVWQLYFHCNNRTRRHQTVIPFCRGSFSPSDTSVWEFPIIWSVIFATASESPAPSFLHGRRGGGVLDIQLRFSAVFQPDVGEHISWRMWCDPFVCYGTFKYAFFLIAHDSISSEYKHFFAICISLILICAISRVTEMPNESLQSQFAFK